MKNTLASSKTTSQTISVASRVLKNPQNHRCCSHSLKETLEKLIPIKSIPISLNSQSNARIKVHELRLKLKADLLGQLKDLKAELALLGVAKVISGAPNKFKLYYMKEKNTLGSIQSFTILTDPRLRVVLHSRSNIDLKDLKLDVVTFTTLMEALIFVEKYDKVFEDISGAEPPLRIPSTSSGDKHTAVAANEES